MIDNQTSIIQEFDKVKIVRTEVFYNMNRKKRPTIFLHASQRRGSPC